MERLYRQNYEGEFVVHTTAIENKQVRQEREWIPNTIAAKQTGHALVIGNGISRLTYKIQFEWFTSHRAGAYANKKLSVYGCNALHRDASPHFLIVNNPHIAKEVVDSGYADNNIVITRAKNILKFPDKFHLIPFDPGFAAGTTALYIAAFDGNRKVYFIGFDGQDTPTFNNNVYAGTNAYAAKTAHVSSEKWEQQAAEIFNTYNQTEFIRVMPSKGYAIPEIWKPIMNFRQIGWNEFVREADIGVT